MIRRNRRFFILIAGALFALLCADFAEARVGGGRSFGSRGGRSLSPSRPAYNPSRSGTGVAPAPAPRPTNPNPAAPPPGGGGFFRSFGGGLAGGLLGGMLFGSLFGGGLGHAGGMGGIGGSGFGLFEILLVAGLGYLAYRMLFANRSAQTAGSGPGLRSVGYEPPAPAPAADWQHRYGGGAPEGPDASGGIAAIRGDDPSFDERRFCDDTATGIFFKVQGAFASRELSPVSPLLTPEVQSALQADADELRGRKQFNRLENIAVRKVEIVEAWQEPGSDFLTVLFRANLLDYTVDEAGALVSGSKTDPVLFEEYWTFVRATGRGDWKLSAISQP